MISTSLAFAPGLTGLAVLFRAVVNRCDYPFSNKRL